MKLVYKQLCQILLFVLILSTSIMKGQYSNYSKSYNWTVFANNTGGGGGNVTLNINNNILSLTFNGGFTEAYLKQGKIVSTDYGGTLPNTEIPIPAGSFFTGKGYRFFIIDNKIAIYHNSPVFLTGFNTTISVNLTTPVVVPGDIFTYLNNWTSQNKITSIDYLSDQGDSGNKEISIMYYDGLGRELQNISKASTPLGKDLAIPFEYDTYGRKSKDFLPIPTNQSNGLLISSNSISSLASTTYNNEPAFSEKVFEASPLNRVLMQAAPGSAWKKNSGHELKFEYDVNTSSDNVKKYSLAVAFTSGIYIPSLSFSSSYETGSLIKKVIKYEDWTATDGNNNTAVEYIDNEGRTLLQRKYINGINVDTYYIYDIYGNLTFVIPPLASDAVKNLTTGVFPTATMNNFCYQYVYDKRNRLVEKKIPGKAWEYMIYDKQDRLVMTQDAVIGASRQWLFTKYDQFGRTAYTGIYTSSQNYGRPGRIAEQVLVDAKGSNNVARTSPNTVGFNYPDMPVYYDNTSSSYPSTITQLLTVQYYDSYLIDDPFPTLVFDQTVLPSDIQQYGKSTKGLPVSNFVKNIEDDKWTKTYLYYDLKGRLIREFALNHLGGYTNVEKQLDFSGTAKQIFTQHRRLSTDPEKRILETFEYDHHNRLLTHKHQIDNNPAEILTQNKYNELSQLETKKVGGTNLSTPLQTIDYKYNIRGWMTQINDPTILGTDLFGYKINYNQVEGLEIPNADFPDQKVKARYNGNISEISWKTLFEENEALKKYGYVYDSLNRLTAGFYQKAGSESGKEYFEKLEYDLNGNITRLKRSEGILVGGTVAIMIDNLKYDYSGSKLAKVNEEQVGNSKGYPYLTAHNTIGYDLNGNIINHKDKGLSLIQYNYLNLPKQITQNAEVTNNTYRADGVKVKKLFKNLETNYLDGFQYKSTFAIESWNGEGTYHPDPNEIPILKLRIIPTTEGYYDALKEQYVYNFTDHLGNVRLSYTDTNKDGIIQPRAYECNSFSKGGGGSGCIYPWKPGEIIDINTYYPFGMMHNYTATSQNTYQYKYNGKELQETGMYDYGARMYMSDIGRWNTVDPLSGATLEPYSYADNNPIFYNDPTGMIAVKPETHATIYKNKRSGEEVNVDDGVNETVLVNGQDFAKAKVYAKYYNSGNGSLNDENDNYQVNQGYIDFYYSTRYGDGFNIASLFDSGPDKRKIPTSDSDKMILLEVPDIGRGPVKGTLRALERQAARKSIKWLVKKDAKLLKLAEETFKGNDLLRKESNTLIEQLMMGNMNPGTGTKNIGQNIFEARARGGARVYFKHGSSGVEIVGYSHKGNQQQVINRILQTYK